MIVAISSPADGAPLTFSLFVDHNPSGLSEKRVNVNKDLRRVATDQFFVSRGVPYFLSGLKSASRFCNLS